MTTLVLTGYNREFAPLGDLTAPRILLYAGKHGYDFKCFHHHGKPIEATWHKVQATLDGLLHYDRVLWVDADMLITNDAITHNYESGFHASLDWGRDATGPKHFSTGAYLICQDAADIFSEVLAIQDDMMSCGIWEQEPIRSQYDHYMHKITVHPRRTFNAIHPQVHESVVDPWQPGDWAAHFTMVPLEERVKLCRGLL